ncbi:hypothetical protein ACI2JA_03610 [Alkalihalobacillus sp. NPDC078783]
MNQKIILTKGQSESLRNAMQGFNKDDFMNRMVVDNQLLNGLEQLSLAEIARAIYIGYEVKLSDDEKIEALVNKLASYDSCKTDDHQVEAYIKGMIFVINTMEIELKGLVAIKI